MANLFRQLSKCYRKSVGCSINGIRNESLITNKPKTRTDDDPILIRKAEPNDSEEILDAMWKHYFPAEPCAKALDLGAERNKICDKYMQMKICNQHSFIARCKYDCAVVGGAINEVINPWDAENLEKFACTIQNLQVRRLHMFQAYAMRAPCIFERFKVNTVFQVSHFFVRKSDRRKGVAKKLITASRDYAADAGYKVFRVDCPSDHGASVCESIHMKLIYEIPYRAYISADDTPVFRTTYPDTSYKIFVALPHKKPSKK